MNYLFLHRNYPAQFVHIIKELAKNPDNKVAFITNRTGIKSQIGVDIYPYRLKREVFKMFTASINL